MVERGLEIADVVFSIKVDQSTTDGFRARFSRNGWVAEHGFEALRRNWDIVEIDIILADKIEVSVSELDLDLSIVSVNCDVLLIELGRVAIVLVGERLLSLCDQPPGLARVLKFMDAED